MGSSGEDLQLSPRARELIPYSIESKSRAAISVYKWLDQRKKDKHRPLVIAKANHRDPIVILYASDFLDLLKRAGEK